MSSDSNDRRLANLRVRPFKPGVSGNPSGRARWEKPFREALERLAVAVKAKEGETQVKSFAELAARRLVDIVTDGTDRDAIRAIVAARIHGWGQPKQEIDLNVSDQTSAVPIDWSKLPLERRRELLAAIDEVLALDPETPIEAPDADATEH